MSAAVERLGQTARNGVHPTKQLLKACDFVGEPLVLGDEQRILDLLSA